MVLVEGGGDIFVKRDWDIIFFKKKKKKIKCV